MRTKTLYTLLFFIFTISQLSYAQSVNVQVDGDDLYYSEPGCGDCGGLSSNPDPRWRNRIVVGGDVYNWSAEVNDESCGWKGITNYGWTPVLNKSALDNILFAFNGYEADNFICGGDDNVCGGYSTLRSVNNICDNPPYTWNTFIDSRICDIGDYRIEWSYYWGYDAAPTITSQPTANSSMCIGSNVTLDIGTGDDDCGRDMGRFFQWQISENTACSGATAWQNIPGATSANFTPPQIAGTRLYRCLVTSGATAIFTGGLVSTSSCGRVTYNPYNGSTTATGGFPYGTGTNAPDVQSGICGSTVLPGTTHTLNTLQAPAVGGLANITGYTWTSTGGSLSASSGSSVTWTAPTTAGTYNVQLEYLDACGQANETVICAVSVGSPNCDFVYVSPSGADAPANGGPNNPFASLSYAIANKGTRNHIKVRNGSYSESVITDLQPDLIIEGGYNVSGGIWSKSSNASTNITFSGTGTVVQSGITLGYVMGLRSSNDNNWKLIDLNIITANASGQTGINGKSNYALWINNSSNYEIIRSTIDVGNASSGSNGSNGSNAGNATSGGEGGVGDNSCFEDDSGSGGNRGSGGSGGNSPVGNHGGTGGVGGYGGAGGSDDSASGAANNCVHIRFGGQDNGSIDENGSRGQNGSTGAGGIGAGGNGGSFGAGACGATGDDGSTGGNASSGSAGNMGSNGVSNAPSFGAYFLSGFGTNGGGGGGGAGGGGGGGGSYDDGGCDSAGSGGHGGGGGGGGVGGGGGGAAIGIYSQGSTGSVINSVIITGSLGIGGTGGTGGNGGNGGSRSTHDNGNGDNGGSGGDGGLGGDGGDGGDGGNGGNGFSYAAYQVGAGAYNPSTSIPTSPEVSINYNNSKLCPNSVIELAKDAGTWAFSGDFNYIDDLADGNSSFDNASATVQIYTENTSGLDADVITTSATFPSYLQIGTDARPRPTITTTPTEICVNQTLDLTASNWGTELEFVWEIYNTATATGSPVFAYTTDSPTAGPFTTAGTYLIKYQVREECCGWSRPAFVEFDVNPDISNIAITPSVTEVCDNAAAALIDGEAATGGNGTYAYQWFYSTDNASFTEITTANGATADATSEDYDPMDDYVALYGVGIYYFKRDVDSGACSEEGTSVAIDIKEHTKDPVLVSVSPEGACEGPLTTDFSIVDGSNNLINLGTGASWTLYAN